VPGERAVKTQIKAAVRRSRPFDIVRFVAHLPSFVKLFFRLLADPRVNWVPKAILLGAAVYAVTPLDFLPDLIPLVGELDDLTIFALACKSFIQLCPQNVVSEHVARIDESGRWRPFGQ
jgi:uncharacterized membrane protein YkvA (DUF1232 family)